jgi:transcriptional regulatory protein RtcR
MSTLSDGGRITKQLVEEEIERNSIFKTTAKEGSSLIIADKDLLEHVLGNDYESRFDSIDIVLLAHTIAVCRTSASAAEAAKKLFAVSRRAKTSVNDSDRLTKFLARFGLKFKEIPHFCAASSTNI